LEAQLAEQTSDALSAKRSLSLQIDSAKEQLSTDKQQIKNLLDDNASLAAQLSATQQELASSMQAQYLGSQQADNELKKATLALNEAEAQLEEAQDKLKKFSVRNELLADAAAEHQKLQNQHTEVLDELSEARRLLQVHDADKQAGILALESKHEAIENALQGTIQQLHDAGKVREENLAAERAAQVSAVEAELQKARSQIRELEQDLSLASQTVAR
jgi:chromosome segregation ATPase